MADVKLKPKIPTSERIENGLFTAIAGAATGSIVAGPVGAIVGAFVGSISGSAAFAVLELTKKDKDKPKEEVNNG